MHGMPVAVLTGHGPRSWSRCRARCPPSPPRDVRQIGLRDVDLGEKRPAARAAASRSSTCATSTRSACARRCGWRSTTSTPTPTCTSASTSTSSTTRSRPGSGRPVRGGPTYREAHLCMEMIADTGRLGSLDIVELNPALDVRSETATARGRPRREPVRQEHAAARARSRWRSPARRTPNACRSPALTASGSTSVRGTSTEVTPTTISRLRVPGQQRGVLEAAADDRAHDVDRERGLRVGGLARTAWRRRCWPGRSAGTPAGPRRPVGARTAAAAASRAGRRTRPPATAAMPAKTTGSGGVRIRLVGLDGGQHDHQHAGEHQGVHQPGGAEQQREGGDVLGLQQQERRAHEEQVGVRPHRPERPAEQPQRDQRRRAGCRRSPRGRCSGSRRP